MSMYCPIMKEPCRKDDCIMWKSNCLIRMFFDNVVSSRSAPELDNDTDETASYLDLPVDSIVDDLVSYAKEHADEYEQASELIMAFWEDKEVASVYELSKVRKRTYNEAKTRAQKLIQVYFQEMLSAKVKDVLNADSLFEKAIEKNATENYEVNRCASELLDEVQVNSYRLPSDLDKYVKKIVKEVEARIKTEFEKQYVNEKAKLPELVDNAVRWARENGLTRFTKADTSTYLKENKLELMLEVESLFYAKVNQELRKR